MGSPTSSSNPCPPSAGRRLDDDAPLLACGPFECLGQRWLIRTNDLDLASFLDELLDPMRAHDNGSPTETEFILVPTCDGKPGWVRRGSEVIRESVHGRRLFEALMWAINRHVIDQPSRERLVLHAAGADLRGFAVLLPAPMESGKTTLVTALLDRGFAYLSDEAIAVDSDLKVDGYPKPLSIDQGSWEVLSHHTPEVAESIRPYLSSQWQVATQRFAAVVRRSQPRLLVFPRYEAEAKLRIERLDGAAVVTDALQSVFTPESECTPVGRVRLLARLAEQVSSARLVYSDLDAACRWIEAEMELQIDRADTMPERLHP